MASNDSEEDVTRLLARWKKGDDSALGELYTLVFDELRRLARRHFRREYTGHTLQPTALVNELYMRFLGQKSVPENRAHFFAMAARLIRRILVDHARKRETQKRGGQCARVALDETIAFAEERAPELLALDEALEKLAELDPEQCRAVELRVFAGLTLDEIAEVMGISRTSVNRKLKTARLWLRRELGGKRRK